MPPEQQKTNFRMVWGIAHATILKYLEVGGILLRTSGGPPYECPHCVLMWFDGPPKYGSPSSGLRIGVGNPTLPWAQAFAELNEEQFQM